MSDVTGLKYLGKNGYPYIILKVPIPARDLNSFDLARLAYQMECTVDDVVSQLATPHEKTGNVLYTMDTSYLCNECGKEYKTWNGYHKHMLEHAESEAMEIIEDIPTEDEESI